MRQGLAVTLCLLGFNSLQNKKYYRSLFLLSIAFSIHASVILFLPFSFIAFYKKRSAKIISLSLGSLFLLLFISKDLLNSIFNSFLLIDRLSDYYDTYQGRDAVQSYGVGFALNLIPFIVFLYCIWKGNLSKEVSQWSILSCVSYLTAPFESIILLLGRCNFYFLIFNIASIPIVYSNIKNKTIRVLVITIFVLISIYSYYLFFEPNSIYHDHYMNYKTIFNK
jgi:hypothetical protein